MVTSADRYAIEYFHPRVRAEVERWPVDVLADYVRLVEMLVIHGPYLSMPHFRAMGGGLFELRPRGASGIARALYCFHVGRRIVVVHAFVKKSRRTPDHEFLIARKRVGQLRHG